MGDNHIAKNGVAPFLHFANCLNLTLPIINFLASGKRSVFACDVLDIVGDSYQTIVP